MYPQQPHIIVKEPGAKNVETEPPKGLQLRESVLMRVLLPTHLNGGLNKTTTDRKDGWGYFPISGGKISVKGMECIFTADHVANDSPNSGITIPNSTTGNPPFGWIFLNTNKGGGAEDVGVLVPRYKTDETGEDCRRYLIEHSRSEAELRKMLLPNTSVFLQTEFDISSPSRSFRPKYFKLEGKVLSVDKEGKIWVIMLPSPELREHGYIPVQSGVSGSPFTLPTGEIIGTTTLTYPSYNYADYIRLIKTILIKKTLDPNLLADFPNGDNTLQNRGFHVFTKNVLTQYKKENIDNIYKDCQEIIDRVPNKDSTLDQQQKYARESNMARQLIAKYQKIAEILNTLQTKQIWSDSEKQKIADDLFSLNVEVNKLIQKLWTDEGQYLRQIEELTGMTAEEFFRQGGSIVVLAMPSTKNFMNLTRTNHTFQGVKKMRIDYINGRRVLVPTDEQINEVTRF